MLTRVISLKKDIARRELFDQRMKGKLDYAYFNAFPPTDILDFKCYFSSSDIYRFEKWCFPDAVIACAKSHFYLWKSCIHSKQNMLILEDDTNFVDERSPQILQNLELNVDFDILYVDRTVSATELRMIPAAGFHRSCSYVVSVRGAKVLVEEIENYGFKRAVDWQMLDMQNNKLLALELSIPVFCHDGNHSNIRKPGV